MPPEPCQVTSSVLSESASPSTPLSSAAPWALPLTRTLGADHTPFSKVLTLTRCA